MVIVHASISLDELKKMSENMYGGLVKAVVDIERNIMAVDAELHADEEALLLDNGSKQENLWGINIYPDNLGTKDFIEFDSMINLRPSQGNKSRSVENKQIQEKIINIVRKLVQ
jgi:hypothetical protein